MFKHILVPLDGSLLAERALPLAARLARASQGSLLLLRVVPTLSEAGIYATEPTVLLHEVLETDRNRAIGYLAQIATSDYLQGLQTHIAVYSGQAAPFILDVAQQQRVDLIVMSSHGYTGITRWALGSVAQKVIQHSAVPVLVLREQGGKLDTLTRPLRALVALDGSKLSEATLLPAAHLVTAGSAPLPGELHLLQLVKLPTLEEEWAYERSHLDVEARQVAVREAGNYLQALSEKLSQENRAEPRPKVTWSVEECKQVAESLIRIAETGKGIAISQTSDVIAMATHGRSGLQRWIVGSVTDRVLNGTTLPLLIVRPQA